MNSPTQQQCLGPCNRGAPPRLQLRTPCPAARHAPRARAVALPLAAAAPQHVVVIGAGIGGLVVAGRLAREGVRVTLLEQGAGAGGSCQSVARSGFRWDTVRCRGRPRERTSAGALPILPTGSRALRHCNSMALNRRTRAPPRGAAACSGPEPAPLSGHLPRRLCQARDTA